MPAALSRRRTWAFYHRLVRRGARLELVAGALQPDALAVVVCLWHRPERIHDILQILDAQSSKRSVRLVLWNNDASNTRLYVEAIASHRIEGSLSSVELVTSRNVGGIGRFLAARELVRTGYSGPFIMMDDDQDFGSGFVDDLLAASGDRRIAGVWAWWNDRAYWNRTQVTVSGEKATYVGTGGSTCDSSLVLKDAFFLDLPDRFLFVEDIWMSQVALQNGWSLSMVDSSFEFVLGDFDQAHTLAQLKHDFYLWLQEPGNVPILS
jgi:hypothetical protein